MIVSTGVIAPNTTETRIKELLAERCESRDLEPDWDSLQINMAAPDTKVGVVTARRKK